MSLSIDNIAPSSGEAWRPEVGDTVKGVVTYAGSSVRESQYSGLMEESIRIDLETDEGTVTIWGTSNTDVNGSGYAKRDAKAIAAAVRAADASAVELGGTLAMKRVEDVPTTKGAAKAYVAEYQAPAVPAGGADRTADEAEAAMAVSGLI